jgi:hypothetical protein
MTPASSEAVRRLPTGHGLILLRGRLVVAVACVCGIFVAGCGSLDSRTSGEHRASPRAATPTQSYRSRLAAICDESRAAARRMGPARVGEDVANFAQRVIETALPYKKRIDRLVPPPALRHLHRAIVREQARELRAFQQLVASLRRAGNADKEQVLLIAFAPRLRQLIGRANRLANAVKVPACVLHPSDLIPQPVTT